MQIVETAIALRTRIKTWRQQNQNIALVPTMGNLHEGHLSLVKRAQDVADVVVVSIFVNPLQFNDKNDLSNYPRTLNEDINLLTNLDCDLVFTPSDEVMYPQGMAHHTQVIVPGTENKLCGLSRPGHFDGVATIVTKLFNIVQPDIAIFGEKDYQQLLLIQKLVQDLNLPIDVIGALTKREDSGLAMSSRNQYLTQKQMVQAPILYKTLQTIEQQLQDGAEDFAALQTQAWNELEQAGFEPEYIEICRADDLEPAVAGKDKFLRILAAAKLGKARLIDNIGCDLA